jgi:hypothetical protein
VVALSMNSGENAVNLASNRSEWKLSWNRIIYRASKTTSRAKLASRYIPDDGLIRKPNQPFTMMAKLFYNDWN